MTEPEHSELPPSSSDKWMVCHGWLQANRPYRSRKETSAAAEEGTLAHSVLESLIKSRMASAPEANPEILERMTALAETILAQDGVIHPETQVDFGDQFGFVNLFGTSDVIRITDELLEIADLKYGRGVVEVEGNTQLMMYLSGAVQKFGARSMYRITIYQPRAFHKDGYIRSVDVTPGQLEDFNLLLGKAIAGNYASKPEFTPGDHCRNYCSAMGSCKAAAKHSIRLFLETPHD